MNEQPPDWTGKTLGHYEVLAPLGFGGMAQVFRARDLRLLREVALKILPPDSALNPGLKSRFEREARMVAALHHPNIVTLYSVEEADDTLFLTMELVDGVTLGELFAERRPHPEELCTYFLPLTEALAAAHARGIVHRDLKPGNVMLTSDSTIKLLDFGVAKLLETTPPGSSLENLQLTQSGALVGTPAYMSPEQLRGDTVTERSDIFSLGVLMYELVSGRHPFPGDNMIDVMMSIMGTSPPLCSELAGTSVEGLSRILGRCLEKDASRRYANAGELLVDLQGLQAGRSISVPVTGDDLSLGRTAFENGSWAEVREHLVRADAALPLSAEDLDKWAEAVWWSGDTDDSQRIRERAYREFVKNGDTQRAAFLAIDLANEFTGAQKSSVANAWLTRAEKLLKGTDCVELGYLNRVRTRGVYETDPERALTMAQASVACARRFQDPNLEAMGLMDSAQAFLSLVRLSEALEAMDEAMAIVSGGELSQKITGRIYCNMIGVCERIADYRRASEWSDVALRWCEPQGDSAYPGICQIHRAGLSRLRGEWEAAEEQVRHASKVLKNYPALLSEATYEMGEIHLSRGDLARAEEAFHRAHEKGGDPMPGIALLRLAQGNIEAARELIDRALEETAVSLERARFLPAAVEISVAGHDYESAAASVQELTQLAQQFKASAFDAAAREGTGLILLDRNKPGQAIPELKKALAVWTHQDFPPRVAHTRLLLGRAYLAEGNRESARMEFQSAKRIFERLGAARDLERTEQLIADV